MRLEQYNSCATVEIGTFRAPAHAISLSRDLQNDMITELMRVRGDGYKRIVLGMIGEGDVEDVLQDAYQRIATRIAQFNGEASFSTWTRRIITNQALDYLRKKKVRKLDYTLDVGTENEEGMALEQQITDGSLGIDQLYSHREFLGKILGKITEQERRLLIEKEVEGLSIEELSSKYGMNQNTVKVKAFRARQKLQKAAEQIGTNHTS